jgi:hypothetical protein
MLFAILVTVAMVTVVQKMGIELENLEQMLKDEVSKLKGHVTLDINLERGRSIEAVSWDSRFFF